MSYIGSNKLGTMCLGTTKIGKAYLGDDLVYSSAPALPYTPLTWVGAEGTNANRIGFDVGVNLTSTMTWQLDEQTTVAAWAPVIRAQATFGAKWADDKNQLNIYRSNNNRYDYLYFNVATTGKTYGLNNRHTFKQDSVGLWADSTEVYTISNPQSVAAGGSIWIFGYKIYNFKLWNSGTLIRDLIPAIYEGDYGLWDTINDTFYSPIDGTITGG